MRPVSHLVFEIQEREARRENIRKAINRFCKEKYGIEDFFALADSFFAPTDEFAVCLARQVPTINVEHAACHVAAKWLSQVMGRTIVTLPLALTRDRYVSHNPYKQSLVKLPWLARSNKSGQLVVNNQKIVCGKSEGLSLGSIKTVEGKSLPVHHYGLREQVFGANVVVDLSPFFQKLLEESLSNGKGPGMAYQMIAGGEEKQVYARPGLEQLRPPADWAYFFHLMLFLDGKRALLSTVGDNDEVSAWFSKAILAIEGVSGVSPLIIDTPVSVQTHEYKSNLLEDVKAILQERWEANMVMPPSDSSFSVFQVVENFEKQVISLA